MFKAGFGWITTVAPILVAAPLYFSGKVSFGGLMMAAAALTQVESALRWFVAHFRILADWRTALLRGAGFPQAREARRRGATRCARSGIMRGARITVKKKTKEK